MEERRARWGSPLGRGLAILAVAALAIAVVSPSFGAAPLTKAKVKKIAKKQATKVVKNIGPGLFIEETELDRYGQVKLQQGGSQVLGTYGPFTLTARCDDNGGLVQGRVIITTSEDNTAFETDEEGDEDFDQAENPDLKQWAEDTGNAPGGAPTTNSEEDEGHAQAPSGTSIDGRTEIYTNFAGSHCVIAGYVITTAPQA